MPHNFDYFLSYFREKINSGEKQVDIAESDEVRKSTAWVNKMYRGDPKSCPIATQRSVADYFRISYEEMIEEGKLIYEKENPNLKVTDAGYVVGDREIPQPEELIRLLNHVIFGIKENSELCKKSVEKAGMNEALLEEIELYKTIFSKLNEGVTFYNSNRNVIFSSNRWGLLDEIDDATQFTFDAVVLGLRKKIVNFGEVLDCVSLASKERKEMEIDVDMVNGAIFHFRVVPIFKGEVFMGSLLINTQKAPPKS